ncbi:unnamed protein product [Gongylonema pulchrum]|uniref:DDE_Tnp_1_7 domain-containing protein n=1 Tax=Gongylonema pulchrum TaxID=637853 RepID=A0A183E200_9BILA|nr:unnamed protein product [Gongylonema pulchrum]
MNCASTATSSDHPATENGPTTADDHQQTTGGGDSQDNPQATDGEFRAMNGDLQATNGDLQAANDDDPKADDDDDDDDDDAASTDSDPLAFLNEPLPRTGSDSSWAREGRRLVTESFLRDEQESWESVGRNADDFALLSHAERNEGEIDGAKWVTPTQRPMISYLDEEVRRNILTPPFATLVSVNDRNLITLTKEVNSWKNQFAEALGRNQLLTFKIKNLSRENARLQGDLLRLQSHFENTILQQQKAFRKTENEMRTQIICQEQDLKAKEFRERLKNAVAVAGRNSQAGILRIVQSEDSPLLRLKKVQIPGNRYRRTPKRQNRSKVADDASAAAGDQENLEEQASNRDGKGDPATSPQEYYIQTSEDNPYDASCHLPDNQLFKLCKQREKLVTIGFWNLAPNMFEERDKTNIQCLCKHFVTTEPWYVYLVLMLFVALMAHAKIILVNPFMCTFVSLYVYLFE